jgi:hypothetical protein
LPALLAVGLLTTALGVQLAQTPNADANVIGFCGNVQLGPMNGSGKQSWCYNGTEADPYQAYAWGEHSVCVNLPPWSVTACSSGTNGVYSGELARGDEIAQPEIWNNTNTTQYASGVYLTR